MLRLVTNVWSKVECKEPIARSDHCAVVIQNKMFVFGGSSQKGSLGDLLSFDFSNKKFSCCFSYN